MEKNFPKKVKTLKVGDKVICIDKKQYKGWYMKKGVIRTIGTTPKSKEKEKIGVEFEENINKNIKTTFKTKKGYGGYLDAKNLMKYTKDFDVSAFKKHFESKSTKKVKKPKKQQEIKLETDQEEDDEQSKLTQSNKLAESQVIESEIESNQQTPLKQQQGVPEFKSMRKQEVLVEAPLPKSNDLNFLSNGLTNDQTKKLVEENTQLQEEKQKIYVEFKKIQIENTKHIYDKQNLQQQLKEANLKLQLIEKNYNDLKSNQNQSDETKDNTQTDIQEQQLEEITNLKVRNSSLEDQLTKLEYKLKELQDIEQFKTKFEESTIQLTSLQQEKENLQSIVESQKVELEDLKERYEIFELEGQVVARDDQIPDDNNQLRDNYRLLLKAFENLDIDIEIQKEEYEYRIIKLNEKIAEMNQKQTNIFASEEVRKLVDRKDNEIKNLYQLVDQYSQSNNMVERLTEQLQQKDDEFQKLKGSVDINAQRIVYLEEENQLLDEIMAELEQNLELEQQKFTDQIEKNEQIQKKHDDLKMRIENYESRIQALTDEKQELAFQTSQLDEDKQQISSLNFQFTKAVQVQQSNLQEKIFRDLNSKQNYWESVKYQTYMSGIPTQMQNLIQVQSFDAFKDLLILITKMDIIQESLCTQFLFDQILQQDNLNFFGAARDVFDQICQFQIYTNILLENYSNIKNKQGLSEIQKSQLYELIYNCQSQIDDLYTLVKNNEFSPSVVFSHLQETNLQLKEKIKIPEEFQNQNCQVKIELNQALQKIIDSYINKEENTKQIDIRKKLIPEFLSVFKDVYQINFDNSDVQKILSINQNVKENLSDLQAWLNSFYKKLHQKIMDSQQMQEKLQGFYWKENVQKLKDRLDGFDQMQKDIQQQNDELEKFKEQVSQKIQEIEVLKDQKLKLDNKILQQQSKINNMATIELEIQELKKIEQSQQKKIEELKNRQPSNQVTQQKEIYQEPASVQRRFSTLKDQVQKKNTFFGMVKKQVTNQNYSNLNVDYKPREKFEINSLNAIVQNLLNQLIFYKKQLCRKNLNNFKDKTPNFQLIINEAEQEKKIVSNNVKSTVNYLKITQHVIKQKVSKLQIASSSQQDKIDSYVDSQNMINGHYINSKNLLQECTKRASRKLNFEYDIDYKKELEEQRQNKLNDIYGKLKLLNNPKPKNLSGKKLQMNIDIK